MNSSFKQSLVEKAKEEKKLGKLIILAGPSGAGKSFMADILVDQFHFSLLNKYVTRPFRETEIRNINNGKNIGLKPVRGKFNDGEKELDIQKQFSTARKQAFKNLNLPLRYENYEELYGFSLDEIDNSIEHGRNVVAIIYNNRVINKLKNIYGENCQTCYLHRVDPNNINYFLRMSQERGSSTEDALKRQQQAMNDFKRYAPTLVNYDHIILNTENNNQRLYQIAQHLVSMPNKKMPQIENDSAKIYVIISTPAAGKNAITKMVNNQGCLDTLIMPKMAARKRVEKDGEEMICMGDTLYDMDACDIQYINYGTTYGIDTKELEERQKDGISSTLILSNIEAIQKLKQKFSTALVPIYVHGSPHFKDDYILQHQGDIDSPYYQQRIEDFDKATELYYELFSAEGQNKIGDIEVILNVGDSADLKLQLNSIIDYYSKGRNWSKSNRIAYQNNVRKHQAKYRNTDTKEFLYE